MLFDPIEISQQNVSTAIEDQGKVIVFFYAFRYHESGTAREYVETFIFPTLLPALYHLFTAAKENLVFEVRLFL